LRSMSAISAPRERDIQGASKIYFYILYPATEGFELSCILWYIVPSIELIRCKERGQSFDTVDFLREHMRSVKDEIKNRVRGLSDG